jgi:hypothetical protein
MGRWPLCADVYSMQRGHPVMPGGVSAALLNVALATLYALFLIRHANAFVATHELPLLAVVALETMVVVMFVTRREASVTNLSPPALAATALGTFSTLFVAPIQSSNVPSAVTVTIQLVGLVMAVVAMGSLRRSFGLAPANRGVKTSGM